MSFSPSPLDHAVQRRFMSLDQGDKVQAEQVWFGGKGSLDLRGKTRTISTEEAEAALRDATILPEWNQDGSSTAQADGSDSEILIRPVRAVRDPFRGGKNIIVLCEGYKPDGTPAVGNNRAAAVEIFNRDLAAAPWQGIEQEQVLFESDGRTPLGWPKGGFPGPQGPQYCSVGSENAHGRHIAEAHYRACLQSGIKISGVNAEVMAGQWEFQIGPCEGIESGDHLSLSRYFMMRIAEEFDVVVSFHPKPITGDWNGSGCHTNYSTKAMREDGGMDAILAAIKKLEPKHAEHMEAQGESNDMRLTGLHETAPFDKFSQGVAHRGASIRIPRAAEAEGKGYFEDRRPASNMDPYVVTSLLFKNTQLA